MADVVIDDLGVRHRLPCPADVGELRKLVDGFLVVHERAGRRLHDDEVRVTVEAGNIVLELVDPLGGVRPEGVPG